MKFISITLIYSVYLFTYTSAKDNLDEIIADKKKAILEEHNKLRSYHGVPPLQLDDELSKTAQNYADDLASRDALITSVNDGIKSNTFGENLWLVEGGNITQLLVEPDLNPVQDWYKEYQVYPGHFDKDSFPKYGHFTQVVWKNTKKLGVGIAIGANGKTYVICDYEPKGNIANEFEENVPALLEEYKDIAEAGFVKSSGYKKAHDWVFIMSSFLSAYLLAH